MKKFKKSKNSILKLSLKSILASTIFISVLFYYPTLAAAPTAYSPLSTLAEKFIGNPNVDSLSTVELRMLIQAEKVENYLSRYGGDLSNYAYDLVKYANIYDLPYNLVAAIGVLESGACQHQFADNNCFGWGNKVEFESIEDAIKTISLNLGGQNPKTANFYRPTYTIEKRMSYYNSVNPVYWSKLQMVMKGIDNQNWQEEN